MENKAILAGEYYKKFGEPISFGLMPPEDRERFNEIVSECIRTGKPYDNYIKQEEGTTQDYGC